MKNPSIAASALCSLPLNLSSNSIISNGNTNTTTTTNNGPYISVPTRESSSISDVRSPVGRNASGVGNLLLVNESSTTGASCWHALLRNRLRFGVGISVLILFVDIVLRFSWLLRFYHQLFPSIDAFVLCTQFLEVFRRALWNLLRVEWENLKQSGQHHQHHHHISSGNLQSKVLSSIQLTSLTNNDEETTSFIRGTNKLTNLNKKTVGK